MSGVITAVVATGVISAGVAAYSGSQAAKAAKKAQARLDGLQYLEDPNFTETQDTLKKTGNELIEGKPNEYYAPIGQAGGGNLEDIIKLNTRDITQSAMEAGAKSGRSRGGAMDAAIAGPAADAATKLRYSDFERSLAGKQFLLGMGNTMLTGVRSAAFGNQQAENSLEQSKVEALNELDFDKANAKSQTVAGYGAALTSIINRVSASAVKKPTMTSSTSRPNGVSTLGSIQGSGVSNDEYFRRMNAAMNSF